MGIKMHRVILILGVLLFPKPLSALECYECIEVGGTGSCSEKYCPASQQCGATATRTYAGVIYVDLQERSCVPSARCDVSGSMDFGITRTLSSTKCCSTDLCNVQYPTTPSGSPSTKKNGKMCFTCKDNNCYNILSCSGDQDRCISSRVESGGEVVTTKGCVSRSLCKSPWTDNATFAGVTTHESCCEGWLCNSATGTAVSLLLLLAAPVVSVALFN